MLRNHLHTTLPSEIFSFPGEEPSAEVRAELKAHGAQLRVVEDATRDPSRKCVQPRSSRLESHSLAPR